MHFVDQRIKGAQILFVKRRLIMPAERDVRIEDEGILGIVRAEGRDILAVLRLDADAAALNVVGEDLALGREVYDLIGDFQGNDRAHRDIHRVIAVNDEIDDDHRRQDEPEPDIAEKGKHGADHHRRKRKTAENDKRLLDGFDIFFKSGRFIGRNAEFLEYGRKSNDM